MKTNDLKVFCEKYPDRDIFVAITYNDGDTAYHKLSIEEWDESDPKSHFIIYPGELISG